MDFSGTFKVVSRDNAEAFFKAGGASEEQIATVMALQGVEQTITQDGDNFTVARKFPKKTVSNTFTIGQESSVTTAIGKELKMTPKWEGSKLVAKGEKLTQTMELSGDTLTETLTTANGVTMTRISKKC